MKNNRDLLAKITYLACMMCVPVATIFTGNAIVKWMRSWNVVLLAKDMVSAYAIPAVIYFLLSIILASFICSKFKLEP